MTMTVVPDLADEVPLPKTEWELLDELAWNLYGVLCILEKGSDDDDSLHSAASAIKPSVRELVDLAMRVRDRFENPGKYERHDEPSEPTQGRIIADLDRVFKHSDPKRIKALAEFLRGLADEDDEAAKTWKGGRKRGAE